jgi:hypothetical protein
MAQELGARLEVRVGTRAPSRVQVARKDGSPALLARADRPWSRAVEHPDGTRDHNGRECKGRERHGRQKIIDHGLILTVDACWPQRNQWRGSSMSIVWYSSERVAERSQPSNWQMPRARSLHRLSL